MDYDFNGIYNKMTKNEKLTLKGLHVVAEECWQYLDALAEKKEEFSDHPEVVRILDHMIRRANKDLENLEFDMQKLWGIPTDPNYHIRWLYPSRCRCPKMDNTDPMYYGAGKIISGDCPIHGMDIPKDGCQ